jgi:hypothetical protein
MEASYQALADIFRHAWTHTPSERPGIEEFRVSLDKAFGYGEQMNCDDNQGGEYGGDTYMLSQPLPTPTDLPNDADDNLSSFREAMPPTLLLLDTEVQNPPAEQDVTASPPSHVGVTESIPATPSHTSATVLPMSSVESLQSQVEPVNVTSLQHGQPPTGSLNGEHPNEEIINLQELETLSLPESSQAVIQPISVDTPVASTTNRGTMRLGLSASMTQPHPVGVDSPRTIRLRMLASELPEDLRRDLLWERKTNRIHPHNTEPSPIPTCPEISS